MISVKPFEMEDLNTFAPKDGFVNFDLYEAMLSNLKNPERDILSLVKNKDTVALLGLNHHKPGVGELWLIPSNLVDKYKSEFFKNVYRLIHNYVFPALKMRRLIIAIDASWGEGKKWAEKLGFNFEGIMKGYGDNYEDHVLYAKVV